MKKQSLVCFVLASICLFVFYDICAFAQQSSVNEVYMPDGQLVSHPVKVYVTQNISSEHIPKLRFLHDNAEYIINFAGKPENRYFSPSVTAPNQEFVDGQHVTRNGTLMIFDLKSIDIGFYQSMTRVMPELSWNESAVTTYSADSGKEKRIIALGMKTVNIGNRFAAIGWTVIIVGSILLALRWLSKNEPLKFLTAPDGHLSLAKTQFACWTVAVGFIVLSYGLIRLEIPSIPESLLALMGASMVTGGVASFKEVSNTTDDAMPISSKQNLTLTDLVRLHPSDQPSLFKKNHHPTDLLSLSKAQMLFWTVLLLVLFMTKSLLHGEIWEIPWELAVLMGFSQAGYLAPKLVAQQPDEQKDVQHGSASIS